MKIEIIDEDRVKCDKCRHYFPLDKVYRLEWKYQDKVKRYVVSDRPFVHSGSFYYCSKCLAAVTKKKKL